jgi:hypothetical protein
MLDTLFWDLSFLWAVQGVLYGQLNSVHELSNPVPTKWTDFPFVTCHSNKNLFHRALTMCGAVISWVYAICFPFEAFALWVTYMCISFILFDEPYRKKNNLIAGHFQLQPLRYYIRT